MLEDSDDDNEETFASMVSTNARKRKRGGSVASSKRSEPAMKYKAGGSGIHRPLDANSKKNVFEYGSEYKATKAKGGKARSRILILWHHFNFNIFFFHRYEAEKQT